MSKRWDNKPRYAIQIRMPDGTKMWMDNDGNVNSDIKKRHTLYYKRNAESVLRAFKRMNSRFWWRGAYRNLPKATVIPVKE